MNTIEKKYINYNEWKQLIHRNILTNTDLSKYVGIFGVPRGGILIAQYICYTLNIPLLEKPCERCLVVDDLIDSGLTREEYKDYDFMVLINKQKNKNFSDKWIEFWYENTKSDDKDLINRIKQRFNKNEIQKILENLKNVR